MRSIQGVLSEVAYAERSCQYLIDALRQVETAALGATGLTDIQQAGIEAATRDITASLRHHLDAATRHVEDWKSHIENIAG